MQVHVLYIMEKQKTQYYRTINMNEGVAMVDGEGN